jgi:hypothetical protein
MSDIVDPTQKPPVQVTDLATPAMPPQGCPTGCVGAFPSGVSDTDREAEEFQVNLLRVKTPAERLAITLRLSREIADACKAAIQRAHPEFSAVQLGEKFVELQYGKALAEELRRYRASRNQNERARHE